MTQTPILHIAIPLPLRKTFDYLPGIQATNLNITLQPGLRVKVPFGRNQAIGIIVSISGQSTFPIEKLKPVNRYLDHQPLFDELHFNWLKWINQYYHHAIGETLFTALPTLLRKDKPIKKNNVAAWRTTAIGQAVDLLTLKRAPKQKDIVSHLQQHHESVAHSQLIKIFPACSAILKKLEEKGLIESVTIEINYRKAVYNQDNAPQLNEEQHLVVSTITAKLNQFSAYLVDGVTGSGKTEVYLQIIQKVIEKGQQALLLIPEIGLTPQLLNRFNARFSNGVCVIHSAMTDNERFNVWQNARKGNIQILIGTRSAVFTPLPDLGCIIIDEEHDLSFKQQDGLKYSARDIAIIRASKLNIPVILGSATPSFESIANTTKNGFQHLFLKNRAGNAKPPKILTIDLRHQQLQDSFTDILLDSMKQVLAKQQQVLLFLNRRGYAPAMICQECGWFADCNRCDRHMTIHHKKQQIICHHCGAERRLPHQCPKCSCIDLRPIGFGTERLENTLREKFPDTDIIRIDRDTTSRKNAIHALLDKVEADKGQILLGTQMLAKGHDFPNVTLVGILDADQGLFGADMRSEERMAQLITQVAGRSGRGEKPGQVLIQTLHPEHALLQTLIQKDYRSFSKAALNDRRLANLPPYAYAALIRAESTVFANNYHFLSDVKNHIPLNSSSGIEILGPAPSLIERRAGKFRTQLLLLANSRTNLHQLLGHVVPKIEKFKSTRKVRWSLDVDPMEMS